MRNERSKQHCYLVLMLFNIYAVAITNCYLLETPSLSSRIAIQLDLNYAFLNWVIKIKKETFNNCFQLSNHCQI